MDIPLLRKQLLRWFKKHQRDHYPWRQTKNPYHILIAETFLQRTRANQVLPVYLKFLKMFPKVSDLASADEQLVKDTMYPLGLAWRSKNLKKTAFDILTKFNGEIPRGRDQLLNVVGVGEYIADCIRYLCFDIRTPIIDSNVVRILGRLYGIETHAESRRNKKFRQIADDTLPPRAFRNFNLALLDLGALICISNARCFACPIKIHCTFYKSKKDHL